MTQLKAICASHAIDPIGDKRLKQTWIDAVATFESSQTVIETSPIPDRFETEQSLASNLSPQQPMTVELNSESLSMSTPQPPTSIPHRKASIVVVIIIVFFSAMFVIIKGGFTLLTWIIAAVLPVSKHCWRYLVPKPTVTQSIDYIAVPV